jgi:multicomponent Na+:H+ antiporter subunit E
MAALWWVLLGGATPKTPLLLAAWVLSATLASLALVPPRVGTRPPARLARRIVGGVRFATLFAVRALLGGVDVLSRAFRPSLPVRPGFIELSLRLESERARVFLGGCTSLLPGTLCTDLEGRRLLVHALDVESDVEPQLRRLEELVAVLFDSELEDDGPVSSRSRG